MQRHVEFDRRMNLRVSSAERRELERAAEMRAARPSALARKIIRDWLAAHSNSSSDGEAA